MDAFDALRADRVAAVLRGTSVPNPARLADSLALGGVRCVEFTFTIPDVVDVIKAAAASTYALVGVGTVLTPEQAERAIEAGATFVVSPACRPALVDVCKSAGVPIFLGALTPSEVADAIDAGATAIKIFPAGLGGPSYIKDLAGPFPSAVFIPSGGVNEENVGAFFDAGCPAVYAGSGLAPPDVVAAGDYEQIRERARRFVGAWDRHHSSNRPAATS
jgi:2-dehydro-3-deoxyphosphogluconate aldolase/(4S)-4-hydroxy-2-oxoglutarate aldolase